MTLRERPDESRAGGEAVSEATIRNAGAPFFRYGEAETAYLKRRDAQLGAVIDRIGPIERKVAPDPFTALVECVVDQQISAKAARTVRERLDALAGDVTPERIAALSADEIQKCGMTMKKAVTIAGIANVVLSGELDPDALRTMSDDDVVTRLTALDGIGLWTAEMVLIFALGRRVLRETCRIGCLWIDAGHPPLVLAVNVSAKQLHAPAFADEVLAILAETGFPPALLEIEITESSLMSSPEQVVPQLQKLRANDIRIAVDDFGTGYSSLAYLKRFPLDVLKIDGSFVEHLAQRKDDREIVTAIIQMGHTLGFRVVAEGVETAEQLAFLKKKGCDIYQGYLGSPPLPAEEFEALLQRRR